MIKVVKKSYSYFLEKQEKQAIVYEIHKKGLTVASYCKQIGIDNCHFTNVINGKTALSVKFYNDTIKPLDVKLKLPSEYK